MTDRTDINNSPQTPSNKQDCGEGRALLPDMLKARERRACEQAELIKKHGLAVISFSMNIPGEIKTGRDIEWGYEKGKNSILAVLNGCHATIVEQIEHREKTGYEFLICVDIDPLKLKKKMCRLEDDTALGRLFDIDVIGAHGEKVSREDLSLPARKCLICDEDAFVCARSRKHPVAELKEKISSILSDAYANDAATLVAKTAEKAMLSEVLVTPKPGLVDRNGSGAHDDMDIFTFTDSAAELYDYLRTCAMTGIEAKMNSGCGSESDCNEPSGSDPANPAVLFEKINVRGLIAEQEMYSATGGVNTHKGLIFSMGLLCLSYGYCLGRVSDEGTSETLTESALSMCSAMAKEFLEGRIKDAEKKAAKKGKTEGSESEYEGENKNGGKDRYETAGEKALRLYGVKGILGEAASGFESARKALPIYRKLKDMIGRNDAGVITLLKLMSLCDDTNMIKRAGYDEAKRIREEIEEELKPTDIYCNTCEMIKRDDVKDCDVTLDFAETIKKILDFASVLDKDLCERKISPGGAADLLAVVFMINDMGEKRSL